MATEQRDGNAQWKRFSGDDLDGKAYRRWKLWVEAKMAASKDITSKQRGPFVYCLLDGTALESVEHLTLEKLQEESGDRYIWDALNERYPDKQQHDWLAECLREVFQISANEGEGMMAWTSRGQEVFSKCKRKVQVDFPTEARGWICLHAAGLTEDQRAIVTAKTQGDMRLDVVMAAMRSCFPDFKAPSKTAKSRGSAAYVVEEDPVVLKFEPDSDDAESSDNMLADVEAFLADHGVREESPETFSTALFDEKEVAEILAATWKEKRAEITKLQRSRKFTQASNIKKQFAREASDLKRKSKCWNCGRPGHWSRDCTAPKSSSASSENDKHKTHGAAVATCLSPESESGETFLVSSPGFGIVDSGCSRTLIGQETLNSFLRLFHDLKLPTPETKSQSNLFRFGNGSEEWSERVVTMPIGISGRRGSIEAAIIKGNAPLLLSRTTMRYLQAVLDFSESKISLLGAQARPMTFNEAGQVIVNMLDFEPHSALLVQNDEVVSASGKLSKRERRVVLSQVKAWSKSSSSCKVAELFSPPRFARVAEEMGYKGLSFDLQQGWDLTSPSVQRDVSTALEEAKPELLVVCPECKHWGGWYRLNQHHLSMVERLENQRYARKQVDFCVQEIKNQIKRGGRVLIEHPWSSDMWQYSPMMKVTKNMFKCRVDLCAYGLVDDNQTPILKPTAIMVSHADMRDLALTCPGHATHRVVAGKCKDGENVSCKTARYTHEFCRKWLSCVCPRPQLCSFACLEDPESLTPSVIPESPCSVETAVAEVCAACKVAEVPDKEVLQSLTKLHNNLGHPSDRDLLRILKNAGASNKAIALAADFEKQCTVCMQRKRPTPCLPVSPSQHLDFNHRIGLDVKLLPGWQTNQRVKCLNIVDYASNYQVMLPFYEVETAGVLRKLLREGWLRWAGPPVEVVMDPATTNMAESMISPLEQSGVRVLSIAAEAHNQLGKVETHGRTFVRGDLR